MSEQLNKPYTNEKLYLFSLYFVSVGVLYLWGFWATFNINILEYLSLPDVVKYTAYPIASAFVFTILGSLWGGTIFNDKQLPEGEGAKSRIGIALNKHHHKLFIGYTCLTGFLLASGSVIGWNILPALLALPITRVATRSRVFENIFSNKDTRLTITLLLAILPFFAYGQGRIRSHDIKDGYKFEYVTSTIPGLQPLDGLTPDQLPRYLGHTGDFAFFFDPSKDSVIIAKLDTLSPLVIRERLVTTFPWKKYLLR